MRVLSRLVFAAVLGLSLVAGVSGTASAAEPDLEYVKTAPSGIDPACPQPGQRVKRSDDPRIFLVGPDRELNWIPTQEAYFSLWDNGDGIIVDNRIMGGVCQNTWYELNLGHLAKSDGPAIYAWDYFGGGYRWITSPDTFNKYGFSWGKVKTVSCICDTGPNWT